MGDVLHAMPAVAALRKMNPQCWIGWAVEPRWLPLLKAVNAETGMPLVNETFVAATRDWKRRPVSRRTFSEIAQLRRETRSSRFDLCVDMQGSIRSAVIGRMAGARELVGPADPREGPARWFYGRTATTTARHVIEQGCELLGAAVGATLSPTLVDFPLDATVEKTCDALLARLLPGGERFVLIAADGGMGSEAVAGGAVRCCSGRAGQPGVQDAGQCRERAGSDRPRRCGCKWRICGSGRRGSSASDRVDATGGSGDCGGYRSAAPGGSPAAACGGAVRAHRPGTKWALWNAGEGASTWRRAPRPPATRGT